MAVMVAASFDASFAPVDCDGSSLVCALAASTAVRATEVAFLQPRALSQAARRVTPARRMRCGVANPVSSVRAALCFE